VRKIGESSLFWKKKNKESTPLYRYENDPADKREFVRVSPLEGAPVKVSFGGAPARLIDISAGGIACRTKDQIAKSGDICKVKIKLPGQRSIIEADVRVLAVSDKNTHHCRFIDLPRPMADAIHHYVLEVQKEELRQQRKKSTKNKNDMVQSDSEGDDL
jgi:c-di-GMP-binding flagellar brake protein YcgR